MTFLGILQALSLLVPLVNSAVSTAETVFGAGRGSEKLKHATQAVEEALPQVEGLARNVDVARAAIVPLIEATVAAANVAKRRRRRKK